MILLFLLVFAVIGALSFKFEFFKPDLTVTPDLKILGKAKAINIISKDEASGLKEITVTLVQKGKECIVSKTTFPKASFLSRGSVTRYNSQVLLKPAELGQVDGAAVLRISARDHSWWGWFNGNNRIVEKKVQIRTQPPSLSLLSTSHNINLGGSGLVVYQTEPRIFRSGVVVGDKFFRGYPKPNSPLGTYMAFFAMPREVPANFNLAVAAEDEAGNKSSTGVPNLIKFKPFRTDKIVLGKQFLDTKMPEFVQYYPELKGSPEEVFVQVNHKLRSKNELQVAEICAHPTEKRLWQGPFLRMKNAAPKAMFGDQRIYTYDGKELDKAVHLGVDLASNEHAPIEAANAGLVIYTGYLGIYGNVVFIDHGQGIFSMYAHMSRITVSPKQSVEKGAVLGYSGSTGLAGGDHLHFAIMVEGIPVNPVEWWDEHWIKDNVVLKLS